MQSFGPVSNRNASRLCAAVFVCIFDLVLNAMM